MNDKIAVEALTAALLAELLDDVAELGQDERFHGEPDRAFGAWCGKDNASAEDSRGCSRHDGGGADIFIGQVAEDFPEADQSFFQHAIDGFEGRIPVGDAGSAVHENGLHRVAFRSLLDHAPDLGRIVFDHMVTGDVVPVFFEQAHHELPAGVRLRGSGIAARDDHAYDAVRRLSLVVFMRVA